jgi:hypothetical protein
MLANFSGSVTDTLGRTVAVQPPRQMVERMVRCVTEGLTAPGVHRESGSAYSPDPVAWQDPDDGWRWTIRPLALE